MLVYMNARNDLSGFAAEDINQMEAVGSSGKVNIVVEFGVRPGPVHGAGGVSRYLIRKDTDTARITSPRAAEPGGADMGDYRNAAAFGVWAKARYPAKKYLFIVWSHGSGWMEKSASPKGISYDYETGRNFSVPELGLVLKEMGGVDLYASDACFMQMAEVITELRNGAAYIAGSEEMVSGDGYPYREILSRLADEPSMSAERLGRMIVDATADYYSGLNMYSTQSLIRTAAVPEFIGSVNDFTEALLASGDKKTAMDAMRSAQSFVMTDNKDLYHFVGLVSSGTADAAVREKGAALAHSLKGSLIAHNRTAKDGAGWYSAYFADAHGVSVYLPGRKAASGYGGLAWSRESGWDELIAWMAEP